MTSQVAVVKGERGYEPVFKALDLIDYKTALTGYNAALIKVNFITTKTWDTGATTDPLVVEAIIKKLQPLPVKIYIAESDATMTDASKAFAATGMKEMAEHNDVEFLNLRYVEDKVKIEIPNGKALKSITVPRIVAESAIISAAKLKTHGSTKVTLGMKNMFGLLPDKFKGKYHMMGISSVITDINSAIKPVLTVIDGFVAMEGMGPVSGSPVKMDLIIAGKDVVATDATACRIMGFEPKEVAHIRMASERGLGNMDDVEILGDPVDNVKRSFVRA